VLAQLRSRLTSLRPARIRARRWAERAASDVRRQLDSGRLEDVRVPAPPALPNWTNRTINEHLISQGHTCLVRALVTQEWLVTRGLERDVVIGVGSPQEFEAHAWVDGEPLRGSDGVYTELMRLPARRTGP
jgi:hypothetical protein